MRINELFVTQILFIFRLFYSNGFMVWLIFVAIALNGCFRYINPFYLGLPLSLLILGLCKKAHIGLLPTFADTYGYSVLEMQACGCAMITTDIRSLPEINNEICGWICHLPQNEQKEALYKTDEERMQLKNTLSEQLGVQIQHIVRLQPEDLLQKAISSWERIEEKHNPINYSDVLKNQYIKLE